MSDYDYPKCFIRNPNDINKDVLKNGNELCFTRFLDEYLDKDRYNKLEKTAFEETFKKDLKQLKEWLFGSSKTNNIEKNKYQTLMNAARNYKKTVGFGVKSQEDISSDSEMLSPVEEAIYMNIMRCRIWDENLRMCHKCLKDIDVMSNMYTLIDESSGSNYTVIVKCFECFFIFKYNKGLF